MTGTTIALIGVFGTLGYLLVGLVATAVTAAICTWGYIEPDYWWVAFFWPFVAVFGALYGLSKGLIPAAKWFTLRIAKRLNPKIQGWENIW